jgi:hypothetical protein
MFGNFIIGTQVMNVILFALRQAEKYGANTDWTKVKATWDERIPGLVPGTANDAKAVRIVNAVLDAVALAAKNSGDIEAVVALLAAGQVGPAVSQVIKLLEKNAHLPKDAFNVLGFIANFLAYDQVGAAEKAQAVA